MNHDALIDRIAREMTDAEPRPDFRARVLSHVAPRPRWPGLTSRAGLVAAAAICAWAILPSKHVADPAGPPNSVTAALSDATPRQPLQDTDQPETTRRPTGGRQNTRAVSAEELAWRARAIPPLPLVAPLQVDPIQPQPLSITPITVHPIVSDPLTLTAIDPRAGGRE